MKAIVILALFAIVASLGHALYSMSSGEGNSASMIRALTWRIGLSIALFAFLMLGWYFGLIAPHEVR